MNAGNVIGQQVEYEDIDEIENQLIRARQYAILLNACIMIPILVVLILVCEITRRRGNHCGIPVQIWVELIFIILLVYVLLTLNELWIIRCNRRAVIPHALILGVLFLIVLSALTIWGYVIYFSDDNNC